MHGPRPPNQSNQSNQSNGSRTLGDDRGWLAVARPKNASDAYLVEWVKDTRNPCYFNDEQAGTGPGIHTSQQKRGLGFSK